MSQPIIQIDGRSFLLASIQIPVEMLDDGSHKIHGDIYKIDFLDTVSDPDMLAAIRQIYADREDAPTNDSSEDAPSMMEELTRILAEEIKPRRTSPPQNSSFKKYVPQIHRKTPKQLRFSRKSRDNPIQIIDDPSSSSDKEDADSPAGEMDPA
jgi:hypothetical protein